MRWPLITLVLVTTTTIVWASSLPLTAKEISLMLRSGYSSDAVLRELSTRHFADTFDAAAEKQLNQAGATVPLLDALRSGTFATSPSEMAALRKKLATQEERTVEAAEEAPETPKSNGSSAPPQRPTSPRPSESIKQVYRLMKGDLVYWHQGSVARFDDETLQQKKLFIFFFSANWSAPGRKFTPRLIEYYNRVVPQHPELEVIFFSADRSQFGMETYLGQSNMPWPAVDFPKVPDKAAAMQTSFVSDLPCLILVDAGGRILSKSSGEKGASPDKVLADLDRILAHGADGMIQAR